MMKKLEGRSLKHPGCLIGITVGLTVGIVVAGLLAYFLYVPYNVVVLLWLGMTLGLGALGWVIGARMTPKSSRPQVEDLPVVSADPSPAQENSL